MSVSGVEKTPSSSKPAGSSAPLAEHGFQFKVVGNKVQITNTGKAPLKLDCISGAKPGGGFFPDLAEQPPLNKPIGVGQSVTVEIPDGWSGNFYRRTGAPDGKPSKENPADLLELTNAHGVMNWDITAIDGSNCAMSTTNDQGEKVGIDQAAFRKMADDAVAQNLVVKDASGNAVAIKAPTVGDGPDVSEADRIRHGYSIKDYYNETSYVVDPKSEKLYRQYFTNTYILPDDDNDALFSGNSN
jgi:hypothetical protein